MSDERLDDETERLMRVLCDVGIRHAVGEVEPAKDALRARIRELVEEARRSVGMNAVPGKLPAPEWDY